MAGSISRGRGGLSRALRIGTLMIFATTAGVIAACDRDAPTGLKSVDAEPARVVEIASPANSAYDYGINRNDTYVEQVQTVAETTTVTSSEPFDDPNTGQQTYSTTVGTEPQTVNVSAGYGYDGQPRVTTGFQQSGSEETIWLQRVTDVTVDSRADGSSTQPYLYEPMDEIGSLRGAYLDAGSGGGSGGGGGCTAITGCNAFLRAADSAIAPLGATGPAFTSIVGAQRRTVTRLPGGGIRIEEVLQPSGDGLLGLKSSAASSPEERTERKTTRDYERQDGEWLLKHTLHETFVDVPGRQMRFAMHLTVVKSKVHRNRKKDAERRGAISVDAPNVSQIRASAPAFASEQCDPTTAIIPCSTDPASGNSPEPPAPDLTTIVNVDYIRVPSTTGPGLVMQHGLWSDGRTWARMEGWLTRDLSLGGVYRLTVPWDWKYEDQAGMLQRKLANAGAQNGSIFVGHSNGGMVSRYLARHPGASNDASVRQITPKAVITVGTPHQGTAVARHLASTNRLFGWGGSAALLLCRWANTAGCDMFSRVSSSTVSRIFKGLVGNPPVIAEMQPNDAYHRAFNSEPEGFMRFSVSSHIWTRWMFYRGYGDAYCYPESSCGGAAQVRKVDRIYKHDIACTIVAALFGRFDKALRCAADGVFLRVTDEMYRRYVNFAGDGIVEASSQRYPNIPQQDIYVVEGGPFHWRETASQRVGNRLETILTLRVGVQGSVTLPQ